VRIATWNCARGPLASKRAALDRLAPHIGILTEASRPESTGADVLWFGEGSYGVALYAVKPFRIREVFDTSIVPCVYPVAVEGPVSFTLFGVWTWPKRTYPKRTYMEALLNGLAAHARCPGPWVVAGDINGNVGRPRVGPKWKYCFERLAEKGLVSAYHSHAQVPYGQEKHPTHYYRWKENNPFHVDYCFLPADWAIEAVAVEPYADWSMLSDHCPISVDVRTV